MNYYISDLHFFHKNVTGEGSGFDGRPYATLEEMHEDMVYILGDVSLRGRQEELIALVSTLKGHKILIRGNHDDTTDLRYQNLCTSRLGSRFEPTTWAVCCRIWITNLGHLQRS